MPYVFIGCLIPVIQYFWSWNSLQIYIITLLYPSIYIFTPFDFINITNMHYYPIITFRHYFTILSTMYLTQLYTDKSRNLFSLARPMYSSFTYKPIIFFYFDTHMKKRNISKNIRMTNYSHIFLILVTPNYQRLIKYHILD